MASDVDTAPLVGRAELVQTVRSALLDDVAHGQTAAVFLTGESGVGKTRLLAEVGDAPAGRGAPWCSPAAAWTSATPPRCTRCCRRCAGSTPSCPPRHARTSSAVRGLLQMFADETAGPDGAGALLERVSRGLHLIAEGRPLVLVLDDLQWVDRSTRQLLLYLLAGLGDLQLSVLAAVRAESLQGAHPLRRVLTELRRLRTVRVLDLAPLDRADTDELAAAVVGRPLAAGGRRAGVAAQRRQPVRRRGAGPRPARRPRRAVRHAAGDLPDPGRRAAAARARRGARGGRRCRAGASTGCWPRCCGCPRTS